MVIELVHQGGSELCTVRVMRTLLAGFDLSNLLIFSNSTIVFLVLLHIKQIGRKSKAHKAIYIFSSQNSEQTLSSNV